MQRVSETRKKSIHKIVMQASQVNNDNINFKAPLFMKRKIHPIIYKTPYYITPKTNQKSSIQNQKTSIIHAKVISLLPNGPLLKKLTAIQKTKATNTSHDLLLY